MLMFLREDTERALDGQPEQQEAAGIDDPEHLRTFIDELQAPPHEGAPSYLKRFRDFADVMIAVAGSLNLGRNLSDTIARRTLLSELTRNLGVLVKRHESSAFPRHWWMTTLRKATSLTPDSVDRSIKIESEHFARLINALIDKPPAGDIHTGAIEQAVRAGTFLVYDPATATITESPVHQELIRTLDDIERLRKLENLGDWAGALLGTVSRALGSNQSDCYAEGRHLTVAFAFYDRLEDIFKGHIVLCKVLLGLTEALTEYERRPVTPLGEAEEQNLRAEEVSPAEVAQLIRNEIWPFGTRPAAQLHERIRDRLVQSLVEGFVAAQMDGSIDTALDEGRLRELAEKVVDGSSASPDEGLKGIPYAPTQRP